MIPVFSPTASAPSSASTRDTRQARVGQLSARRAAGTMERPRRTGAGRDKSPLLIAYQRDAVVGLIHFNGRVD